MAEFVQDSTFFSIALTIGAFSVGAFLQRKWKLAILNPILIGAVLIMAVLAALDIPWQSYQEGCRPLQYLLTPATICLAISFAQQLQTLKKHLPAIIAGTLAGTACSLGAISLMARAFHLSEALTSSLLPKSITTAIGVALCEEAGGIGAIATAAIVITGILGNVLGPALCKLFGIKEPVAQGVAYGTASHVIGTSKAVEIGELTGAVSGLALTLAGIVTAVAFSVLLSV